MKPFIFRIDTALELLYSLFSIESGGFYNMYSYPTNEASTDVVETRLDTYKRHREINAISGCCAFEWKKGLDYGCGIGRNLEILRNITPKSEIVAYDKDSLRLRQALDLTRDRNILLTDEKNIVEDHGLYDLILACQVLGHTSTFATSDILDFLYSVSSPDAKLVCCIPFITNFNTDYFHVVNFDKIESMLEARTSVSTDIFNKIADKPEEGKLPVRCFNIEMKKSDLNNSDLFMNCQAPESLTKSRWKIETSFIYSIHDMIFNDKIVGDIIIKMIKND